MGWLMFCAQRFAKAYCYDGESQMLPFEGFCLHVGKHRHTHTYMHRTLHICIDTHLHALTGTQHVHIHIYTHTQIHTHMHMHACTHARTHTHTHIRTTLTQTLQGNQARHLSHLIIKEKCILSNTGEPERRKMKGNKYVCQPANSFCIAF